MENFDKIEYKNPFIKNKKSTKDVFISCVNKDLKTPLILTIDDVYTIRDLPVIFKKAPELSSSYPNNQILMRTNFDQI